MREDLAIFQGLRLTPAEMEALDGASFKNDSPVKQMCIRTEPRTRPRPDVRPSAWIARRNRGWYGTGEVAAPVCGGTISPVAFGGDPTGTAPSGDAVQRALEFAGNCTVSGRFIGNSSSAKGATVALLGEFLIERPLRLPRAGGLTIENGALRATSAFPPGAFMLTTAHFAEDVAIRDVLLDCRRSAAGGLYADDPLRLRLDGMYIVGFTAYGLKVSQGHELHLTNSYLGEVGAGPVASRGAQPHGSTTVPVG